MKQYSDEELEQACTQIQSFIQRCEKAQPKFQKGTSQYTLLKNRIQSFQIANSLLLNSLIVYNVDDLSKALLPIQSIIHKCKKAQVKYDQDHKQYQRYVPILHAMAIAEAYLIDEQVKE